MRKKTSQKITSYFTYEIFVSDAFRDLKPSSKEVLILLYFEVDVTSKKKKGQYIPVVKNRHDIKLPYEEIIKRLGYSKKAVWSAFKDILAHGFIEVVSHGGGMKGDFNIYGISEDWRKWEPGQTIREIRKNGKVGWQDRTKISRPVGNPETKNTLDTVPSTRMLKPVTKYCSDCRHMREGMTKCGPALFCQHPLESKHGFSKFRSEFCTVDQELYVPKLSRFARLVSNIYRFVKK